MKKSDLLLFFLWGVNAGMMALNSIGNHWLFIVAVLWLVPPAMRYFQIPPEKKYEN